MVDEPFDVRMKNEGERLTAYDGVKRSTLDPKSGSWSADVLKKALFHALSLSVRLVRLVVERGDEKTTFLTSLLEPLSLEWFPL